MNYINFSKSYHVRMLIERDIPLVLALCEKNTQFYEHCPPFVTAESIRDDMWMATSKVNRSGKRISSQIPD